MNLAGHIKILHISVVDLEVYLVTDSNVGAGIAMDCSVGVWHLIPARDKSYFASYRIHTGCGSCSACCSVSTRSCVLEGEVTIA